MSARDVHAKGEDLQGSRLPSGHAVSGTPERAGPPTNVGLRVLPAVRVPVDLWFRRASDLVELVGCPVGHQVLLSIAWSPTTLPVLVVSVCGLRAATKVNKVARMTSPPYPRAICGSEKTLES